VISQVLREEYEDGCEHHQLALVLPSLDYDCEGGSLNVVCAQCGERVEELVGYE